MPIAWTPDLNIGIDVIDSQHRQLVDYINQLEVAAETRDRPSIAMVFDELVEYTMSHFAFEEQLQIDAGYVFATAHKSIHDVFVKRLDKYRVRFEAGEDVVPELQRMLNSWLLHHIKRDDRSYAQEIQSRVAKLVEDKKESGWLARSLGRFFK